jgi:sulfatase maturation enzyme AslB (radical SAM superfamily)
MAVVAALPKGVELRPEEAAVTFVVPAPNGCNLDCAFCIVRARGEARPSDTALSVQDYVDFLEAAHAKFSIGVVGLQGYEPLLPDSWGYSAAILRAAKSLGLRTAIVTNGTYLAERVDDLAELDVDGITVSLDSADSAQHDSTRRTVGAFAATMNGLCVAATSQLRDRLLVTSVLQPGKRGYLEGLPGLLASLGIRKWVVTPLYKIRKSGSGGMADKPESVLRDTLILQRFARAAGVELLLDDEFSSLSTESSNVPNIAELYLRRLKRLDQVLRLSPNGSLSTGMEILRPVGAHTALWRPQQESAESMLARATQPMPVARVIRLVQHV